MRETKKQTLLMVVLAVLTAVFSLGFFAGRRSIPYAVTIQTERAVQTPVADERQAQPLPESRQQEAAADTQSIPSYPLDLNTATLEELMELPRIGEKLAQRILDYRAQYGRFSAPEQLMDVEGIGEATFEGLKELVMVEDENEDTGR